MEVSKQLSLCDHCPSQLPRPQLPPLVHPAGLLLRLNKVTEYKALSTVLYKWHFKKWQHYFHYQWSWASKRVGSKQVKGSLLSGDIHPRYGTKCPHLSRERNASKQVFIMDQGSKQGRLPGRGSFETETRKAKWAEP